MANPSRRPAGGAEPAGMLPQAGAEDRIETAATEIFDDLAGLPDETMSA